MNFKIRLSYPALVLLLTYLLAFAAGYQQGMAHTERFSPLPGGGVVCPPQGYIAIAPTTCPKA